jgi:seryl-tRNA synthetase
MLDLKYLRENLDQAEARLATRGAAVNLSAFRGLDLRRRELLGESEALKAEKNRVSALIGQSKDKSAVSGEILRSKEVSSAIKVLDDELREVETALETLLLTIPNLPHEATPIGHCEENNCEINRVGTPRPFSFAAKPHWEVGEGLGILDFERAGKLAGARFAVLRGAGARLERALATYMLDLHTERHGYTA